MHRLISMQKFSGQWLWNDGVAKTLSVNLSSEDIANVVGWNAGPDTEDLCATALAIAFLEKYVADKKEVWEMVVEKAKQWMQQVAMSRGQHIDGIVDRAAQRLEG
jgi:hypothetical protein